MEYLALWMFVALFALIILGFPIAFCLIGVALVFGIIRYEDIYIYQLLGRVESIASNWVLAAVPLFVFMGSVLERSGIAERLFDAFRLWTRNLPGGIAIAAILMCVMFAASSGVVGATEAVVGLLAIPAMLKYGYDKKLISGVICSGGSLGTIIPPSVVLIILGPMANVSIGRLFAAAMIPGLVLAFLYLVYVVLLALLVPSAAPRSHPDEPVVPLKEKLVITAKALVPPLLLVVCVLGSILAGIASPTEAAAVGGAGGLILSVMYGSLTWKALGQAIMQTLRVTTMIMFILMGGMMFTSVFFSLQGMSLITGFVSALDLSPWMFLFIVLLLAFLLGFFLEWISILLIFIPIFTPLLTHLGFDPIWFCILFLLIIQTSYLTPPMAPAIFYLRGISPPEITLSHMYWGMVPFLLIQGLMILLVILFPQLALWLPNVFFG
ncbi:tripartite ATP-independent transporter DctM subunit [Natronocella acetinitrilica]|uniref:TRAP transporter large permease protein n=2 Tax=Natronocella acetinitrilica TaxID=414046 RepID=A0AAE3G4N2_9GAMM|nr:tripartite ATP-independent transporter DctM subunit [Natronocella acetinitrilica]